MNRFTVSLEQDLYNEVAKIAEKNKHSLSVTVSLLLHNAINERKRKRKKVPAQYNSANMGTGNSE